jgi:hypothetical protein
LWGFNEFRGLRAATDDAVSKATKAMLQTVAVGVLGAIQEIGTTAKLDRVPRVHHE